MERARCLLASPGPCPQHPALLPGPAEGQPLSRRLCAFPTHGSCSQHCLRCRRSQLTRWVGGTVAVGKVGCGPNSLWKQVLDLPVLGEVCPLGAVVSSNSRQQCSWRHLETPVTAFPYLHVQGPCAGRALQAPRTGAHPRHRQVDKSSSGQLGVLNTL